MTLVLVLFFICFQPIYGQDTTGQVLSDTMGDYYFSKFWDSYFKYPDSILFYLDLAKDEYLRTNQLEKHINVLNGYSSYYHQNGKYDLSHKYANEAFKESQRLLDPNDQIYANSLNNYTIKLIYIGNYKEALDIFKDVLRTAKQQKDTILAAGALKNIGDSYNDIGDYDHAIQYYDEILSYGKSYKKRLSNRWFSNVYLHRGIANSKKSEYDAALTDLNNAIKLLPPNPSPDEYLENKARINIYYEIANVCLAKNQKDSLFTFVNDAQKLSTGKLAHRHVIGHEILGKFFLKNKDYRQAIHHLSESKSTYKKSFSKFKKHISYSTIDNLLADSHFHLEEYEKAIQLYKNSILNLKNSSYLLDQEQIPSVDDIYNPYQAIEAFTGLGEAYKKLYATSNDIKLLKLSHISFSRAALLIDDVRNSFEQNSSLLRYSGLAQKLYESCIEVALKMHTKTKEAKYLEEAFHFCEKSKAALLYESMNKSWALQKGNIPDSLRQREKEYNLQIADIKRKIYNESNTIDSSNAELIEQLNRNLFRDVEKHNALIKYFERQYPQYYQLKYGKNIASIQHIQEKLKNTNSQIIEYFIGEKSAYIFSISHNRLTVQSINNPEQLYDDVLAIQRLLSNPPSGANFSDDFKRYLSYSKRIYENGIRDALFPDTEHLIFINDGVLGYLPFEAIITDPPEQGITSYSSKDLTYLIEDYQISYSYSATLFLNSLSNRDHSNQNLFLGIAPTFGKLMTGTTRKCNEEALYNLQCSENEVVQIQDKLDGKTLLGDEATLSKAKKEMASARIIHLATHACLDDANPEFNKIYLADDYLSNNDLYGLKLNSELAVLSACETGTGQLAVGEGVMSLARGFIHAGCPSIVMSLWSIDDCATSRIMVKFYDELKDGRSKTEALKNAKLHYISNAKKANQHPYYWAAFVQIGNFESMDISSNPPYLFLVLGVIFLILLFFIKKLFFKS